MKLTRQDKIDLKIMRHFSKHEKKYDFVDIKKSIEIYKNYKRFFSSTPQYIPRTEEELNNDFLMKQYLTCEDD